MRQELGEPVSFGEVQLDAAGQIRSVRLREIPVHPLTSTDIASMPLVERVAKVKDIQLAYARPHLVELFPHSLREVRPDALNLAATISDIQSKDLQIKYYEVRRKELETERIGEVQAIRQGQRGRRRIEPKIQTAVKQWQDKDEPLKQEQEAIKILRETTIDGFIKDVFFEENGPERFLLAAQDLRSQTPLTSNDIVSLLSMASERLRSLRSPEHARFFKYKEGTDNFVTEDDAWVLKQVINVTFGDTDRHNKIATQLQDTARDLLDFYWTNIDILYRSNDKLAYENGEKTPRLALFYDLLFSSMLQEDVDLTRETLKHVWSKIDTAVEAFRKEHGIAYLIGAQEHQRLLQIIIDDCESSRFGQNPADFILSADDQYFQKWDPTAERHCFEGKYFDRVDSFGSGCLLAADMFNLRPYHDIWIHGDNKLVLAVGEAILTRYLGIGPMFTQVLYTRFTSSYPLSGMIANSLGKKSFVTTIKQQGNRTDLFEASNRDERQQIITDLRKKLRSTYSTYRTHADLLNIVSLLFSNTGVEGVMDMRRSSRENRELFKRIQDMNLWFVVTHGDQFNIRLNPDQANHSVESVTFYPDARSRGWRIELVTNLTDSNNKSLTVSFILNSKGKLLDMSRDRVRFPAWFQIPFETFLLKRLWFITSGVLGDRAVQKHGEEVGYPVEVRRSHWRVLTSTEDRVYTLTSEAARHHAEYVLDTYGIDIYAENLRRRSVGALGQNQVITFVRAVEMSGYPPNQLTFNPALLEQAV